MECLVIAEAGVNHNSSVERALQMVDVAADAGADAIKFQTFNAGLLVRPGAKKAEYQQRETGAGDQLEMLRTLELPRNAYPEIIARCQACNIEFLSTPFDEDSASMLVELGMRRLKVPSGEVTNLPFLEYLAGFALPMILSTGMAALDEVAEAVDAIQRVWSKTNKQSKDADLTLLHCTSNYPAQPEDVNLRAMQTMHCHFNLPVGYSDHTLGSSISVAAVAMGACVIEKHFTLDHQLPGPDHQASLEPYELSSMIQKIRDVEAALGDGIKAPRASELPVREVVRRSITLKRGVETGEVIQDGDLALMRPGNGISPKFLKEIAGRKAAAHLEAWHTLQWDDLLP